AMFYAAEARGHALMGDARATAVLASRAVGALERAEPESGDDPVWIRHFDGAYLADELAHCHRDLGQPEQAARQAREALAALPAGKERRRAIGLLLLAAAQVQQREVEQACQTAGRAAELLSGLRSSRGAEYLDDFRARLEPYREEAAAREFAARLEAVA
ncbi:transcriptional regulator, partial [Streptomyces toxytricini]